mgnify:CR=1 FL=1
MCIRDRLIGVNVFAPLVSAASATNVESNIILPVTGFLPIITSPNTTSYFQSEDSSNQ